MKPVTTANISVFRLLMVVLLQVVFGSTRAESQMPGEAGGGGGMGGRTMDSYQEWVRNTKIQDVKGDYQRGENSTSYQISSIQRGIDSNQMKVTNSTVIQENLRGASDSEVKQTLSSDMEEMLGDSMFQRCNNGRDVKFADLFSGCKIAVKICSGVSNKGTAKRRVQNGGMRMTGNRTAGCSGGMGDDEETGNETDLICQQEKNACIIHMDNPHPDKGAVIGAAYMSLGNYYMCRPLILSASYVDYYVPWFLVNFSRQMYQSSYLPEGFVNSVRSVNWDLIKEKAGNGAVADVLQAASRVVSVSGTTLDRNAINDQAKDITDQLYGSNSFSTRHRDLMDLSPANSHGYVRNLSSPADILISGMSYSAHFGLSTHRFGTDLPSVDRKKISLYQSENASSAGRMSSESSSQGQMGNIGNFGSGNSGASENNPILYSRFFPLAENVMAGKYRKFFRNTTGSGGPFTCIANNKNTGKTPGDLLDSAGSAADNSALCIDDIGQRFPLTANSFSPHDTDAFWRSFISGGLDMFYAVNWPEYYREYEMQFTGSSYAGGFGQTPNSNPPYHSFVPSVDKLYLTRAASHPKMYSETAGRQCTTLSEMVQSNTDYQEANIRTKNMAIGSGKINQNTAYVWGYVKGVWGGLRGFRGWRIVTGTQAPIATYTGNYREY